MVERVSSERVVAIIISKIWKNEGGLERIGAVST